MTTFVTPLPIDFFSCPVTLATAEKAFGLSPFLLVSPALSLPAFVEAPKAAHPLRKRNDSAHSVHKQEHRLEPFPEYDEATIDPLEYADFLHIGEAGPKISSCHQSNQGAYHGDDVQPFDIDVAEDNSYEDEPNRVSHPIRELITDSTPDIDEPFMGRESARDGMNPSSPMYTTSTTQSYTTPMPWNDTPLAEQYYSTPPSWNDGAPAGQSWPTPAKYQYPSILAPQYCTAPFVHTNHTYARGAGYATYYDMAYRFKTRADAPPVPQKSRYASMFTSMSEVAAEKRKQD